MTLVGTVKQVSLVVMQATCILEVLELKPVADYPDLGWLVTSLVLQKKSDTVPHQIATHNQPTLSSYAPLNQITTDMLQHRWSVLLLQKTGLMVSTLGLNWVNVIKNLVLNGYMQHIKGNLQAQVR